MEETGVKVKGSLHVIYILNSFLGHLILHVCASLRNTNPFNMHDDAFSHTEKALVLHDIVKA